MRAAAFAAEGLPLPRRQPTTGFWDRFTLDTDQLLVADSNAYAGPLAWEGVGVLVVVQSRVRLILQSKQVSESVRFGLRRSGHEASAKSVWRITATPATFRRPCERPRRWYP